MEVEASNVPSNSNMTIPAELITEILLRLPVKSLLKFRSISKSWLALISSPEFVKTHLSLSANHHVLILDLGGEKWRECPLISLLYDSVTEAPELDCPTKKLEVPELGFEWLYAKGSCNGLVFLSDYCLEYSLLWNPTTRKHNKLPPFRPTVKRPDIPAFGFGYDELHDDYKVVIISYNYCVLKSDDIEVKVYSLKTDSWTKVDYCYEETFFIKKSPGYRLDILMGDGSFVCGKLHWGTEIRERSYIISFDLSNEKWEKVEKPSYGEEETEMLVGKVGSDLSVFTFCKATHMGAWVMKEYGVKESWMKMFTIRYPNNPEWFPNFFVSNKGEILSLDGARTMIYNSKDDSFRYSDVTNCHDSQFGEFYLESLVSPFPTQGTENMEKAHNK